jgi:hypothetical protein
MENRSRAIEKHRGAIQVFKKLISGPEPETVYK